MLDYIKKLEKVELHVHLEGAIPINALLNLIKKYNKNNEYSVKDINKKFEFNNFQDFIKAWIWKNSFLKTYDDFYYIADKFAKNLCKQNIKYVEVTYSPSEFYIYHGLDIEKLTRAIRKGFDRQKKIKIRLIADLVRNFGIKNADYTLDQLNEIKKNYDIIGITLGGDEKRFPPKMFKNIFKKAKKMGFYTSIHAGEGVTSDNIWTVINDLDIDRIGHATTAINDKKLLNYLRKKQIPIEICLSSNVKTRIIKNIQDHPVKKYFDMGLFITINTDDPTMFKTDLNKEYSLLAKHFNFTKEDIKTLADNGLKAAWGLN